MVVPWFEVKSMICKYGNISVPLYIYHSTMVLLFNTIQYFTVVPTQYFYIRFVMAFKTEKTQNQHTSNGKVLFNFTYGKNCIAIIQESPDSVLEGRCPAEFISSPN